MEKIIKKAITTSNAHYTEINHIETEGTSISISKGEVERCLDSHNTASSVRCFDKGNVGFSAFNNQDFDTGIQKALESVYINTSTKRFLADSPVIQDTIQNHPLRNPKDLSLEEKYKFIQKIYSLVSDPCFSSSSVNFKNYTKNIFYQNSNGTNIKQIKHFTGISIGISMKDGNTLQQAYFSDGTYGGMEILDNYETKIHTIKKRVKELIKAPKVESGKYRVLLNQNLAGVFAHEAFGHMSEADFLADNPELLKKIALGTEIAVPELNITDDGRQEYLCGWCPYDDEGVQARRRELIKDGKINCYLQSRSTAYEMNMNPTGNGRALNPYFAPIPRMTNTYIENGSSDFETLLEELWNGIYACDMIGGMTNLEMFTFSSAYAYRVEKGKITGLIRDVILSGSLFETMKNIIGIGNDLQHHGGLGGCGKAGQNGLPVSTGSPHLLIDNVLIG